MDIIVIIGFCVCAVIACRIIEKTGSEIKALLVLASATAVFIKLSGLLGTVLAQMRSLFNQGNIDSEYISILFKGLGICYITRFAVDFCRDCGENALAGQAELAGKISLLIISLPLFNSLTEIVKTLLW